MFGYDKKAPVKSLVVIGGKVGVGVLAGYAAASILPPLFWWGIRKLNPRVQVPLRKFTPRHKAIGQGLMVAGGFAQNPWLMGIGGGLVANDTDGSVLRKDDIARFDQEHPMELNIVRYNIPDWLPAHIQYNMLGDILTEIITKPTWNETKKIWIPAAREHPDIIEMARKIAYDNVLDGHDKIAVLKAIQSWVQDNIKYVYDPRWLDFFAHPYITLRKKVEDCDGQALLCASLGEALGIPMVLMLIGQNDDSHYNHILSGGVVDHKIYPIETIPVLGKKMPFEWLPNFIHKKIIPVP